LHADLGKLLSSSAVGGRLQLERLPLSDELLRSHGLERARELALHGGDDYELCFTAPVERREAVHAAAKTCSCAVREIGVVDAHAGLRCFDGGREIPVSTGGYDHFGL
jgi:thiamine-monophosphate kinase